MFLLRKGQRAVGRPEGESLLTCDFKVVENLTKQVWVWFGLGFLCVFCLFVFQHVIKLSENKCL